MTLASLVVMVGPTSVVTKDQLDRLDAQFASAEAFEIIWLVGGGRTETVEYLTAVAPHRPNVRLTTAAADRAVAEAQGRYVVLLAAEDQPHPGALERLLGFAEKHRLDTVLGRIAVPGSPVPTGLLRDVPGHLEPSELADPAPGTVLVAVRRELAVVGDAGLEPVGGCGVVGQESVSSRPGVGATAAELAVAGAAWTGDELVVGGRLPVDESPVVAMLEHRASGRQVVVELPDRTPDVDGAVLVRLAPRRALAGRPLLDGVWQALIQSQDVDGGTHLRPLAWTRCPPALLGTEVVIPVSVAGTLALDVGPTTRGLVLPGRTEPSVVEETVRGSLLQYRLPDIHTDGFVGLDGLVGFGDVQVPARLEVDELGVCLRAMATGVTGTVALTARFGRTWTRPTGLSLQVSDTGAMRLIVTPTTAPPKTRAAAPSSPRAPTGGSGTPRPRRSSVRRKPAPRRGLVAAVRRRTPRALEPLVTWAAHRPTLRRLYRKLTN